MSKTTKKMPPCIKKDKLKLLCFTFFFTLGIQIEITIMKRTKIELEFLFRASPAILYNFITAPACLVRWFCDAIDIQGEAYSFGWNGSEEVAIMIDDIEEERIRFKWEDAEDPAEFWEFRLKKSPVTNETILEVIDFCDEDEVEYQKKYWASLMTDLRKETGG